MKTRITQLVAALFFVLLFVGNVNATKHEVKASNHENIETSLEFENWMMDETIWNTSDLSAIEIETNLEMENWMTNRFVWKIQKQGLALENWMTDTNVWEVESDINVATETEQELAMEQWMVKQNIWDI